MSELRSPALEDYLGRVRSHLPLRRAGDIVQELESSIRDRVNDLAAAESRAPDEELVRRALGELGEPEGVAGAYVEHRSLIGPSAYRAFLLYTSVVFVVHMVLVGVATTIDRPLQAGPVAVAPVGHRGIVSLAASIVHALFLDVGLMVFVFAGAGTLRRTVSTAPFTLRVDCSPRSASTRALLSLVVAVVLNVFRDDVFVIVSGRVKYPLFTEWFGGALPYVTALLAAAVLSDVLYVAFGERRITLAVDALHGMLGVACMLWLLSGDSLMAIPRIEAFESFVEPMSRFLDELGTLVVGFLALLLAVKTVRRLIRLAQVW